MNVDATWKPGSAVGLGFVARSIDVTVHVSGSSKHHDTLTVAMAEALALRWEMRVVLELGHQLVDFETDSLVVCNAWKNPVGHHPYLLAVIYDCKSLSVLFSHFGLSHVGRCCNGASDFMANYVLSCMCFVLVEDHPRELSGILTSDLNASAIK